MRHIAIVPLSGSIPDLHRKVWDLVGGESRSFLFRQIGQSVLVSSTTAFPGSQEEEDAYPTGTTLEYSVCLDAVRRFEGGRRRSVPDHELSGWFEDRMAGMGIKLQGVPRVTEIRDIDFCKKSDGSARVCYHAVTFGGKLVVTDTGLFKKLLNEGALRGKSYGLGMFLVKPLEATK